MLPGMLLTLFSRTWTQLDKLLGGATDERIVLFLDEIQFLLGSHMPVMISSYFAAFL